MRVERAILFIIYLSSCCPIFGMFTYPTTLARTQSLGGVTFGNPQGTEAIYSNPADLINNSGFIIGAGFSQPYNIAGLSLLNSSAIIPIKQHNIGIGLTSFGTSLYRETTLRLCYAHLFYKKISIGCTLKWLNVYIENFDNKSDLSIDIGLTAALTDYLWVGITIHNFNQPQIEHDSLYQIKKNLLTGFCLKIASACSIYLNILKQEEYPASINCAFEYKLATLFTIRCGYQSSPTKINMGAGINLSRYSIDYNLAYAFDSLGITHSVSLHYSFTSFNKTIYIPPVQKNNLVMLNKLQKININQDGIDRLSLLPGISRRLASRILLHRKINGPFTEIQQLCSVRGISYMKYLIFCKYLSIDKKGNEVLRLPKEKNKTFLLNKMEMRDLIKLGIPLLRARNIILYRNLKRGFRSLKEFKQSNMIHPQDKNKIVQALQ